LFLKNTPVGDFQQIRVKTVENKFEPLIKGVYGIDKTPNATKLAKKRGSYKRETNVKVRGILGFELKGSHIDQEKE
jgi:hypothetical protein